MKTLRTPDERFAALADFPFEPHYVEIDDGEGGSLRLHHLDEGPRDGPIVLLMHGEPTWSYLYRHMIPPLVDGGMRCVAPDLVGFGRSDKPTDPEDHTYARQVAWMSAALFGALDLREVTMFCQDWGGLIGLRLVGEDPDRFARIVVANTGLPVGDRAPNAAFDAWQQFARETPVFPTGAIVRGGCATPLPDEAVAAYDAPFPDDSYQAGPRRLPALVPTSAADPAEAANRAAWDVLHHFTRPVLCAFSDGDPITRGGERAFISSVPGAQDQAHVTIAGAGHFLQEDAAARLADVLIGLIRGC